MYTQSSSCSKSKNDTRFICIIFHKCKLDKIICARICVFCYNVYISMRYYYSWKTRSCTLRKHIWDSPNYINASVGYCFCHKDVLVCQTISTQNNIGIPFYIYSHDEAYTYILLLLTYLI